MNWEHEWEHMDTVYEDDMPWYGSEEDAEIDLDRVGREDMEDE